MAYNFRRQRRNIIIGDLKTNLLTAVPPHLRDKQNEIINGGKIILPPEALIRLSSYEQSLMIFRLFNARTNKETFCGVLTFEGSADNVFVPQWVITQLELRVEELVLVECLVKQIDKGEFALFQPLSPTFQDITNPKAVLEHSLREYSCISCNDIISIYYNQQTFDVKVCKTRPVNTIAIVECDLQVDFLYTTDNSDTNTALADDNDLDKLQNQTQSTNKSGIQPFVGIGRRSDGQTVVTDTNGDTNCAKQSNTGKRKLGIADYDYQFGTLSFKRRKTDLIANSSGVNTDPNKSSDSTGGSINGTSGTQMTEQTMKLRIHKPITANDTELIGSRLGGSSSAQHMYRRLSKGSESGKTIAKKVGKQKRSLAASDSAIQSSEQRGKSGTNSSGNHKRKTNDKTDSSKAKNSSSKKNVKKS